MTSQITKQYTRLLALWPKDALRPNLPFTRAIEHRGQPFGVVPINPASEGPQKAKASKQQVAAVPATSPSSTNPQLEQVQVNALFSLLEDRYSKKYPLSPAALNPTSSPDHYTRLLEEIERAPHKSWWQAKLDEWKNKIRFS